MWKERLMARFVETQIPRASVPDGHLIVQFIIGHWLACSQWVITR